MIGEIDVTSKGAVLDGQFAYNCSMTVGSADLFWPAGGFTSADVGKLVLVSNANGNGLSLASSIIAYNAPNSVTLAHSAAVTVSGMQAVFATDDTAAIQAAIDDVRPTATSSLAGTVVIPRGIVAVTSLDMTNASGMALRGLGVNTTMIFPMSNAATAVIDLTGSGSVILRDFLLGFQWLSANPVCGILQAPSSGNPGIDKQDFRNLYVAGYFQRAALFTDRVCSSVKDAVRLWNSNQAGGSFAEVCTAQNCVNDGLGVTSQYATTLSNTQFLNCSDWTNIGCEYHGYAPSGASANRSLFLDQIKTHRWVGGNLDSSCSSMIAINGNCNYLHFLGTEFYSENGTQPQHIWGGNGNLSVFWKPGTTPPGTNTWAISGTVTQL